MGTHPLSSRLPYLLKGVRQYKHSGHQQGEDLSQPHSLAISFFLISVYHLRPTDHYAKDKTKRPILITIIKMLYIATALIKFPNKRRLIIRDACSMRFTEGNQFSMNVKDEHKNQKYGS